MHRSKGNLLFSLALLGPAVAFLVLFSVFPLIFNVYQSFRNFYLLRPVEATFVGAENFSRALSDPFFLRATANTAVFMVVATGLEVTLGLYFAVLIHRIGERTSTVRQLLLLPNLLPPVTVTLVWQNLLAHGGLLNDGLVFLGLRRVNWFMRTDTAMGAIILIDIWQWTPFVFLLLFAAVGTVPREQYEAASIDGAGKNIVFLRVTLPNIAPAVLLTVVLRCIDTFRLFDKVNILTKGGPANTTATITQYIFQNGIGNLRIGYASALSVLMVLAVIVVAVPTLRFAMRER